MMSMGPLGPGLKGILIALGAVSIFGAVAERNSGFKVSMLFYKVDAIFSLELWRLVTYPFVEMTPFGLILSGVVLYFFGQWFESHFGTRDFLSFFFLSAIGAGLLAVPLYFLVNIFLPFKDMGMAAGPGAVIDAMLVAFAMSAPNSIVNFAFVFPMRTHHIIYLVLGFQLLSGLLTGSAAFSITLGGMAMGYLLVSGRWRPSYWKNRVKGASKKKRAPHLHVVPPPDETLH